MQWVNFWSRSLHLTLCVSYCWFCCCHFPLNVYSVLCAAVSVVSYSHYQINVQKLKTFDFVAGSCPSRDPLGSPHSSHLCFPGATQEVLRHSHHLLIRSLALSPPIMSSFFILLLVIHKERREGGTWTVRHGAFPRLFSLPPSHKRIYTTGIENQQFWSFFWSFTSGMGGKNRFRAAGLW